METKRAKTTVVGSLLALAGLAIVFLPVYAGNLEPSAPPGPTMKTLDEVEPRTPISQVPYTISESGSYYLVGELHVSDPCANGITIEVNEVTIDLMGFSLIGPGSGTGIGIYIEQERTDVEIRNGAIESFGRYGICQPQPGPGGRGGNRLINVRVVSNGWTGIWLDCYDNLVKDCRVENNQDSGIYTAGVSTITGNVVFNNKGYGIGSGDKSTVTGNTACDNAWDGILAGSGSTVTGNSACDNGSDGIRTSGGGCTVALNSAKGNQGHGISVWYSSTVSGNTSQGNQNNGIDTQQNCTVSGNTASNNGDNGIETLSGSMVTDNTVCDNQHNGISTGGSIVRCNSVYENNQSNSASDGGIWISSACLVKANAVSSNNQNNIYVGFSDNAIEENLVTNSTNGIYFHPTYGTGNFYANNRASGNTTDYANTAGNTDGGGNVSF